MKCRRRVSFSLFPTEERRSFSVAPLPIDSTPRHYLGVPTLDRVSWEATEQRSAFKTGESPKLPWDQSAKALPVAVRLG